MSDFRAQDKPDLNLADLIREAHMVAPKLLLHLQLYGQLLQLDFQAQKRRLRTLLLLWLLTAIFTLISLLLSSALLIYFFWDTGYQKVVLGLITGSYPLLTLVLILKLQKAHKEQRDSSSIRTELAADIDLIRHFL